MKINARLANWKGRSKTVTLCWRQDTTHVLCCAVLCWLHGSVASNSVQPHGLCPPGSSVHGDSPGKNTGVGCHALLQWIFLTQGSKPGLPHLGRFFTVWATREDPEYWSRYPILSPGDLPNPVIKLGSPAMQGNYLPAELPGKPVIIHKKP